MCLNIAYAHKYVNIIAERLSYRVSDELKKANVVLASFDSPLYKQRCINIYLYKLSVEGVAFLPIAVVASNAYMRDENMAIMEKGRRTQWEYEM